MTQKEIKAAFDQYYAEGALARELEYPPDNPYGTNMAYIFAHCIWMAGYFNY